MASANLAQFKIRLAQMAAEGGLPKVALKDNTDLGQAFMRITTNESRREGESDADVAKRYVEEFCNNMTNEIYKEALDLFNEACEAFSAKIKAAWSSLEGIKETASGLAKSMADEYQRLMAANAFVSSHLTFDQLSQDFPVWKWEGPTNIGCRNDIVTTVNGLVVTSGATIPTEFDLRYFNVVTADLASFVTISQVSVSEEERKSLIDQLQTIYSESKLETIENLVDMVLGAKDLGKAYDVMAHINQESPSDYFKNIQLFDTYIQDNFILADSIQSEQVKLGEGTQESLKINAENIMRLCTIMAYWELMMRETTYKASFLLQGGVLNSDQMGDFENAGGNVSMVARYVRYFYKDDKSKIPALGVAGETIVKMDAETTKKVQDEIDDVMARVAVEKIEMRCRAFDKVAKAIIDNKVGVELADQSLDDRNDKFNSLVKKFVEPVLESIKSYNVAFSEAALNFTVKMNYGGTFVECLYEKLGAAYLSMARTNTEVDESVIRSTEVGVVAGLIVEYIADKMIEAVDIEEVAPQSVPAVTTEPAPAQ